MSSTSPVAPEKLSRRKQFAQTYKMAHKTDRALPWWILGTFVVGAAVGFTILWLLPGTGALSLVLSIVSALLLGLLGALIIFGRRAQRAAYAQMDGQAGAAASALQMLRRGWKVDPVVAFTKQQDVVHRVVGPPGIVLVGEGSSPNRLKSLMITERRKHERVVADAPIHEVICGNGEGQVPLTKLVRHVTKLGRGVKPAEMTDILNRLKALDANRSSIPLPKGPMPTSMKGMRGNQRGR
ncbi:MAG: DUF4191 domain-containing protein [Nocardioides sp.]|nr:DUF4191 domain-containing protein [Nocardioides sp.]